jgi:CheY-like chemotaxis protein
LKRILIAEDDQRVLDILAELVAADGYEVIRAADGEAALEQLQRHEVNLLILDINMPGLGGASLVQLLRRDPEWEAFARLPIIIVSGMWDVVTFDLDVQAGFPKPIPLPALRAKVREFIDAPGQTL